MGFEDFTAYEAARREDRQEPVGFALYGEDFECEPQVQAGPLLDFTALGVAGLRPFLKSILTEEAWGRFDELLHDRGRPVSSATLDRIVEALMEQYAGRPTQPSRSSAPTPSLVGRASKSAPSAKAKAARSA